MAALFTFATMLKLVLIRVAPGMPASFWWVTACVLVILALAATIDAFTANVPDLLIFLGLVAVTATQGIYASWPIASLHLRHAILAGLVIWGINFLWYRAFRHDALGMGDAKWTMLAVACFGLMPSVMAWGGGAVLAVCFIGVSRLANYRVTQVTFAPFLLLGLIAALYWTRFPSSLE